MKNLLKLKLDGTGKPTASQRRKTYQFALDIYTGKIRNAIRPSGINLNKLGFCAITNQVFDLKYCRILEMLPELSEYKPNVFYYSDGDDTTTNERLFWFPCGQNKERIKILEEILAKDF